MAKDDTVSRVMRFLGQVLAGLVGAVVLAVALAQAPGGWGHAGLVLAILFASSSVGALLGFLFAVPRVYASVNAAERKDGERKPLLQTNTNLERISDWLTTMLVGVGLSQLTNVNAGLVAFRDTVAGHLSCAGAGSCAALPILAPMILIFGGIAGFLSMYLYTRIELVGEFRRAEELSQEQEKQVRRVLKEASAAGSATFAVEQAVHDPAPITVNKAIGLMFSLLYQPGQYVRVIEIAGQIGGTEAVKRADYWFYLAAAFGQQMSDARSSGNDALLRTARQNALDAARRAVRLDAEYASRLWSIADPNSVDDDLSPLREDPDFLAIVRGGARG